MMKPNEVKRFLKEKEFKRLLGRRDIEEFDENDRVKLTLFIRRIGASSYNPQSAMKGDASEYPVVFIDGIWCVVVVARRARMAIESRTHFLNQSITHVTKRAISNY